MLHFRGLVLRQRARLRGPYAQDARSPTALSPPKGGSGPHPGSNHLAGERSAQSRALRNRSALAMTVTELKLMAALAIMGESTMPKKGNRTPAASGTPAAL